MITEKQALNLGMTMHLLFNSLHSGEDSTDTITWQSGGGDNHIAIGYSFEKNRLTIKYVTINGMVDCSLEPLLQNMIDGLTVDGVLNLAQCHGLKSSGYHPMTKEDMEKHEKRALQCTTTWLSQPRPLSMPDHFNQMSYRDALAEINKSDFPIIDTSTSYWQHQRMELSMKLYSQFLSEYTGSIADVEDDREKLASVAVKAADILIDKLKSQES